MNLPKDNADLRSALDLEAMTAVDHKRAVQEIADRFSVAIVYDGMHHFETCVPYALRLTDDSAYEAIRAKWRHIYAGPDFVEWMIREQRINETLRVAAGDIVCYFDGPHFKHIGVMVSDKRAISKWGLMPRYLHELADVPAAYGDTIRFYERPSKSDARSIFREFARITGRITNVQIAVAISGNS